MNGVHCAETLKGSKCYTYYIHYPCNAICTNGYNLYKYSSIPVSGLFIYIILVCTALCINKNNILYIIYSNTLSIL